MTKQTQRQNDDRSMAVINAEKQSKTLDASCKRPALTSLHLVTKRPTDPHQRAWNRRWKNSFMSKTLLLFYYLLSRNIIPLSVAFDGHYREAEIWTNPWCSRLRIWRIKTGVEITVSLTKVKPRLRIHSVLGPHFIPFLWLHREH